MRKLKMALVFVAAGVLLGGVVAWFELQPSPAPHDVVDAVAPASAPRAPSSSRVLLGEVLSQADGHALAGARVSARLADGSVKTLVTDVDGAFELDDITGAILEVRFAADGFTPAAVDAQELPTVPEAFFTERLVPSSITSEARPAARARVDGVVVDGHGQPVRAYELRVRNLTAPQDKEEPAEDIVSIKDDAGAFHYAHDPPAGRLAFSASADGFRPGADVIVDVKAGEIAHARIVLERATQVTGVVTSAATGAPIVGARVIIEEQPRMQPAVTDAQGKFALRSNLAEEISIRVHADGYADLSQGGINGARDRDETVKLELTPTRAGVKGEVVGIGVSVGRGDGGLLVSRVFPGTPAASVLEVGDVITEVDGLSLAGRSLSWGMAAVRGDVGSTAHLAVKKRDGTTQNVGVERSRIAIPEG